MPTIAPLISMGLSLSGALAAPSGERWSPQQAWRWYDDRPWLCGCNFLPSTAVNDTEMWQAESFDPETIDRELGWGAGVGFNSCRVFLQYLVWRDDPEGFLSRFSRFLEIATRHGLSVMPILFDDCAFAGKEPYPGKQDNPVPGVHNSTWVPSPGRRIADDPAQWAELEGYVKALAGRFGEDRRIVVWDLYNEPQGDQSLPLVEAAFRWAREAGATQPLTVGLWNASLGKPNRRQLDLSDVVTFHCYGDQSTMSGQIAALRSEGRPLLCTEWMARDLNSRFESHLPLLKGERVGGYCWGLVAGKTQTYYPWGSQKGTPEPKLWHHDLFRRDGTPFDAGELIAIGWHTGTLRVKDLVPTSEVGATTWRHTTAQPPEGWASEGFDDSAWAVGPGPFGTPEPQYGRHPRTEWKTPGLWLRRSFGLSGAVPREPWVRAYHDDDVEVYLNGVLAARAGGYGCGYGFLPLTPEGRQALRRGTNLLAVHCRQHWGGQYVDVGLASVQRTRE